MGDSPQSLLVLLRNYNAKCNSRRRIMERRQRVAAGMKGGHVKISRRSRRAFMKRSRRADNVPECSRRPTSNGVERKVRTLKKLVPNSESMGLDGLFRETADYILSLQMRVRVMQVMVEVLSGPDD